MNWLLNIGFTVVALGLLIGVGIVTLSKFASQAPEANSTLQSIIGYLGTTGLAGWINRKMSLNNESYFETAEFRLKSRSRQDRSVKHKNYARTTDKAYFTFSNENENRIYSLISYHN